MNQDSTGKQTTKPAVTFATAGFVRVKYYKKGLENS